ESARAAADAARAEREAELRREQEHKQANAAMVALLAASDSRTAKEERAAATAETKRLDAAIANANRRYEQAEAKAACAAKNEHALLERKNAKKQDVKAAREAYKNAKDEATRANDKKEMLERAKLAAEQSKALADEERAELIKLATELAEDEKNAQKAEILREKIERAAEKEDLAERRQAEAIEAREKALEIAYLNEEAKAKASEEAAERQKQKAERLARQRANEKSVKKAHKAALLEEAKAEKARRKAAELKARRAEEEEKAREHKAAKAALAAFAAVFVSKADKKAKDDAALRAYLGKPDYSMFIGTTVTDAEKEYEAALLKEADARAQVAELEEQRALKKERKAALLALGLAEEETVRAERRLKSLEAAKRAAEKSKELSPEQKAEMLALASVANAADKKEKAAIRKLKKQQKKAAKAARRSALAEKKATDKYQREAREWEKAVAATEARVVVSEERAEKAKDNAIGARIERQNKKALERAYKEALISEYEAEKARKAAAVAKKKERGFDAERTAERKEAEAAMLAFAAAMALETKRARKAEIARRKADAAAERKLAKQTALEVRTAREAEMYARAMEERAILSEQKAFLLVPLKGRKREKLKAYEAALYDRAEANEARSVADTLRVEDKSAAQALPLSRKEQKLKAAAEKAARKQKKAEKRLAQRARYEGKIARADEKAKARYDADIERLEKQLAKADLEQERAQLALDAEAARTGRPRAMEAPEKRTDLLAKHALTDPKQQKLQKKLDKAELAREKAQLRLDFKRYKIEEKVKKVDIKALRKEALAGRLTDEKLRRKLAYEAKVAEKQRISDTKAWNALVARDNRIARHDSYMHILELDRRDRARMAAEADARNGAAFRTELRAKCAKAALEKGVFPKALTRRERYLRNRDFRKLDMQTLTARYDSVIVEAQRDMELALCDLSCTKENARRVKYETQKRVAKLKKAKREALRLEKRDNRRYFLCMRKARIKPKNRYVDRTRLAEMHQYLTELLEERNRLNGELLELYLFDSYSKKTAKMNTPWYKAFIREKKRWHKNLRADLKTVNEMNLSRRDKQRLRADLDRVATAHADIAETKTRIRKQALRGAAKKLQKQEIKAMRKDAVKAHQHMKRKMKIARAKEDSRDFWYVSMLSLAVTLSLVCICVLTWHWFGDRILSFLNARFPEIMSQLK
ncbi:MAG: hypothetical protein J6J66_06895, partial [Clostridia bacterium]|nr:hypothetical protein [Clostridia bacterium]